jgi:Na+-driven multidrug efflux pump
MWAAIFSTIVCRTLLSFILGLWMKLGVIGIAIAMGLDWCIKGFICVLRWKSGKWKSFKVI